MSKVNAADLESAIRNVPDFPKPGIQFKDITPVLADASTQIREARNPQQATLRAS